MGRRKDIIYTGTNSPGGTLSANLTRNPVSFRSLFRPLYQASNSSPEVGERKATGAARGSGKSPAH
jgi:hypothetical protein